MKIILRVFAVILLTLLGIGGIYGGYMLFSDPSGKKFQWTVEMLEGTPFKNFLIPGITLFIVNGLLPLFIAILTIIKAKYYEWLIIIQGCILAGWLSAELIFNKDLYWPGMHISLYSMGIIFVITGIALLRISKNN